MSEATRLVREWEVNSGVKLHDQPLEAADRSDEVNAAINSSIPLREAEAGLAYLAGRGIDLGLTPELDGVLRFLSAGLPGTSYCCQNQSSGDETLSPEYRDCDSVVIVYSDSNNQPQAVQKIAVQNGAKALGDQSKRFVGSFSGSAAVLGPDTKTVVVCEGPETGLAILQALRANDVDYQIRIAGNDSNMSSIPLPATCTEVILAADLDPDGNGEKKAIDAANMIRKTRRSVKIALPRPEMVVAEESLQKPLYADFERALEALFQGAKNKTERCDRFMQARDLHRLIGELETVDQIAAITKAKNATGVGARDLQTLILDASTQKKGRESENVTLDWLNVLNIEDGVAKVFYGITTAIVHQPDFVISTDIANSADGLVEQLGCHPNLYQRGSVLVEVVDVPRVIERKSVTVTEIRPVEEAVFDRKTTEVVKWKSINRDGELRCAYPDSHVTSAVFGASTYPTNLIRPIAGIVRTPVPVGDGRIIIQPGFDDGSGLYYQPADQEYLRISIPRRPTLDDAIQAKQFLFELIHEFPFRSPADRAAWLAEGLTMVNQYRVARNPLYLCEANLKGTGKGKLIDTLIMIALGVLPEKSGSCDDNEMRKKLVATLIAGQRVFYLDNVSGVLGGDTLDIALTSSIFSERLLGVSKMYSGSVDCLFVASGNNCELGGDIDRRVLVTRLQTPDPNHSERKYKIPNLKKYLVDDRNRARYHEALLTIARAFDLAGRPQASLTEFGSFEDWSKINRQTVVWLGEPDPLEPARSLKSLTAMKDAPIVDLIRLIWGWYSERPFQLSEILDRLNPASEVFKTRGNSEKYDPRFLALLKSICGRDPDTKVLANKMRPYLDTPKALVGIGTLAICFSPRENGHESGSWSIKLIKSAEITGLGTDSGVHAPSTMPLVSFSENRACDDTGHGGMDFSNLNVEEEENRTHVCKDVSPQEGENSKIHSPMPHDGATIFNGNDLGGAWTDSTTCPSIARCPESSLRRDWMADSRIELVASLDQLNKFLTQITDLVAWDVETRSLDTRTADNIVGHALAVGKQAIYVPVRHLDYDHNLDPDLVLGMITSCFERSSVRVLVWNHQFEFNLLRGIGINISTEGGTKVLDVMALRYVTHNDGGPLGLKETAKNYLRLDAPTLEDALATSKGKRKGSKTKLHFGMTDPTITYIYGCSDVLLTVRAYEAFISDPHDPAILAVEHEILDLLPLDPFLVDREYVRQEILKAKPLIEKATQGAQECSGVDGFRPTAQQVGKWLTERGAALPNTPTGQVSTRSDDLKALPHDPRYSTMVDSILEIRSLSKIKSTYLDNLVVGTNNDGFGIFQYSGLHTGTGRFSSGNKSNPAYLRMNGQNLPTKGPINIRRAIIARRGHCLAAIDLSQIELRIAAYLSKEPAWFEAFTTGGDPHKTMMELLKVERRVAKAANFGLLYGGSHHVIAEQANILPEEAKEVAENWRNAVPAYMKWYRDQKFAVDQVFKHEGCAVVQTMFGRTRDISSLYQCRDEVNKIVEDSGGMFNKEWGKRDRRIERTVANTLIQGAAADINKRGLINVRGLINAKKLPIRMLLTTHDELVFEVPESSEMIELCRQIALHYTCRNGKYKVDLGEIAIDCDLKTGSTYGDLKEVAEFSLD